MITYPLTAAELATLRNKTQAVDLFLGVYEPPIVFACQINSSTVSKGSVVIPYDNVVTGSYVNVKENTTVYVGTSAGDDSYGRVRLRHINASQIELAPDKSIDLTDNLWLTVRDYFEIWPIFPVATVDQNNHIEYYKDYNLQYLDQNTNLLPVPIFGPHYFGFADYVSTGCAKQINFIATGTYILDGSTITHYTWFFSTGITPINIEGDVLNNVCIARSGFYTAQLSITASNGKSSAGYRHIALFDRPGTTQPNPKYPIQDWKLLDLNGDWETGWIAKVEVGEGADKFKDGYLVGIWADDFYGGTAQSLGGYPGREHIVFVGYVNKIDTTYNPYTSKTTFVLKGAVGQLQNKEMFSVSLEHNVAPSNWTQLRNMTIRKIIDHYFRWHSNLLEVADVDNLTAGGRGDYPEQFEDITKGEILSNINNLLHSRLFGVLTGDKQGRVFAEIDLNMLATGSRPAAIMRFQDSDWLGDPTISEAVDFNVSNVLMGGVSFDFSTQSGTAYLARAPGVTPAYSGRSETYSGLTLTGTYGQDEVNLLAGLYYNKQNNPILGFSQQTWMNLRHLDVAPQAFYERSLLSADTFKKIVWNNKRFIPRKVSIKHQNGAMTIETAFEAETSGTPGETIIIPVTPPRSTRQRRVPTRTTPPPQPGTTPNAGTGGIVYVLTTDELGRTRNFVTASPNWSDITPSGLDGSFMDLALDPYDPTNGGIIVTRRGVYRTTNLDGILPTWTKILDNTIASAQTGITVDAVDAFFRVRSNISQAGFYVILAQRASGNVAVFHTHDYGVTWAGVDLGANGQFARSVGLDVGQHGVGVIYVGTAGAVWASTNGGHSFSLKQSGLFFYSPFAINIPYAGNPSDQIAYLAGGSDSTHEAVVYKTTNGWTSYSDITPIVAHAYGDGNGDTHTFTQDGDVLTGIYQRSGDLHGDENPHFYSSDNGGLSWTNKKNFSGEVWKLGGWPYGKDQFYALGDSVDFYIGFSTDGGTTWSEKKGDWLTVFGHNPHTATTQPYGMIVPDWSR